MNNSVKNSPTVILGAGITGLTSAYALAKQGKAALILERDSDIGGLAKTINYRGFRFDLGGHRFVTRNRALDNFVKQLLADHYKIVSRSSKILFNDRLINYPIEPLDIVRHFGTTQIAAILANYCMQKCRTKPSETKSLEDWVINQFGDKLYNMFFKHYSEKVWGLPCNKIDSDWIAQRIQGLDLLQAAKHALFKSRHHKFSTLDESFLYPTDGIYRIARNLSLALKKGQILCDSSIVAIQHSNKSLYRVDYLNAGRLHKVNTTNIISTLPVATLVKLLRPSPPTDVLEAANSLRNRDLLLVFIMINAKQVTNENWIYFPQHKFPFGRIHEPKNWSEKMAPEDKTSLVVEYFCNRHDQTWADSDQQLITNTIAKLDSTGMVKANLVFDAMVVRVENAYPLFELGYRAYRNQLLQYLSDFKNIDLSGRSGAFQYSNMDRCMLDGFSSAEKVLGKKISMTIDSATPITQEATTNALHINNSSLAT